MKRCRESGTAPVAAAAIDEAAQERKDLWPTLYLVENDEASKVLQGQLGVCQERPIGWELEVEPVHPLAISDDLARECRLADLTSADEPHHRALAHPLANRAEMRDAPNHECNDT